MAQIEYTTIKNASRSTLNKLRKIGIEKAKRLDSIQQRWENGDFKDAKIVMV